jgi:diacylglycerol kinase (ATP)
MKDTGPASAASDPAAPAFKSRGGWARLAHALRYSLDGLTAALRHEAAFRQELMVGVPMIALAWFIAATRTEALLLTASVVLVWIVELLNSAIESLADALSTERHLLLGRAKDMGSAAVLLSLLLAVTTWAVLLGGRLL